MTRRVSSLLFPLLVPALVAAPVTGACGSDGPALGADAGTSVTTTTEQLPAEGPAGSPGTELAGYLDELVVAEPDPSRTDYERDEWEEGLDLDGDCVRTRHEVLTEESTTPVRLADCKVVAGSWVDPLTGRTTDDPTDLEVDHLVALADAHRSGGWRWSADRKAAFTNHLADPDHLNAVLSAENQRKADSGPEAYRPADEAAWCWYATAYARVKATWELTVTLAQLSGLQELAAACP